MLDGLRAGREALGDLGITEPFSNEWEYFKFAIGQAVRIGTRCTARAVGNASNASLV